MITGHGWGHGVGMSQYGAYGFAQHGFTYQKILTHYFTGTQIGPAPVSKVRVLLASGQTKLKLVSADDFTVRDGTGATHDVAAGTYTLTSPLKLKADNSAKAKAMPGPLLFQPGPSPLTLGRRYCLPCLLYFELIQPRFGEGPLEDARPPRFANIVGLVVLTGASVAYATGQDAVGAGLGALVAALALLAAITGFCAGCTAYKIGYALTGRPFVSCPLPPQPRRRAA